MTEREKEITAIENVIDYWLGDLCGDAQRAAVALVDLGYRKLDDHAIKALRGAKRMEKQVRKQTAKEIFDRIEKYICAAIDNKYLKEYVQNILLSERNHFGVR